MRLRVIAGTYGGRFFDAPNNDATHPMGERVRGSLFNKLGDLNGKTILDAFAGSGALSFEAVSRGAASALALEKDRVAQKIIAKNIASLDVAQHVQLVKTSCKVWSEQNPTAAFDLIFADPPYDDMQLSTVQLLTKHLKPNGLMVISYPGRDSAPTVNGVVVVDNRLYGDAALAFYRKDAS